MPLFRRRKPEKQVNAAEDVAHSLAKLKLNTRESETSKTEASSLPFVGGFFSDAAARQRNRLYKPLPARPSDASKATDPDSHVEFPSAQVYSSPSHQPFSQTNMPGSISMSAPYYEDSHSQSLTMQFALTPPPSTPQRPPSAGQTPSPARFHITPRPHSASPALPSRTPFTEGTTITPQLPATPPRSGVSNAQAPASTRPKVPLSKSDPITLVTPPRVYSISTTSAPSSARSASSSIVGGVKVQCSGRTQKGLRCKNRLTVSELALERDSDDSETDEENEPEFFCKVHESHVLSPEEIVIPQTSKKLVCSDFIPEYLQARTQASLRAQMQKPFSASDEPGFIYAFEVQDSASPHHFHIKVGRTTEPNRRMPQWLKQCPSKNPILLALWPEDSRNAFLRGRMQHGDAGPWCHRLEALIHIELKDLVAHSPYLDHAFPKVNASKLLPNMPSKKPCVDCRKMHKEIFSLPRATSGPYKGKEFELLVKPVIERWSRFVREYGPPVNVSKTSD